MAKNKIHRQKVHFHVFLMYSSPIHVDITACPLPQ